jgi:type II secretory pathway component HofQ
MPTVSSRAARIAAALFVLVLPAFLAVPAARSAPGDEVFVYKMKQRVAEELTGPVTAVLSPTGRVSVDSRTNSLVIVDRPENVAQARAMLEAQDVRQRNIQITVETLTRRDLDAMHLEVDWAFRSGGWQIGTIPVVLPGSGLSALATAGAERGTRSENAVQTVTVMNDGRAEIATGHEVPFTDVFHGYAAGHGYLATTTTWASVDTGFVVHPRLIGSDRILLEITPRMRNLSPGGGSIEVAEASTQIEVKDGGAVVIGSSGRERSEVLREILRGGRRVRAGEETYLMVRARTLP